MSRAVTAADANRDFSKLLREVRRQFRCDYSHGKPVAKIVPFVAQDRGERRRRGSWPGPLQRVSISALDSRRVCSAAGVSRARFKHPRLRRGVNGKSMQQRASDRR
jgi:antitoxin (DNA-binding transcriptional repressor) of toxin-antitoxin stability system